MRLLYMPKQPNTIRALDGEEKGIVEPPTRQVSGFFYKCEYLKDCDQVSLQCRHSGNRYCGEYKKCCNKKVKPVLFGSIVYLVFS